MTIGYYLVHGRSRNGLIPAMKVTEKGQVTIPKELRDALGIGAGTNVAFERNDETIVIRKVGETPTRGRRLAEHETWLE